MTCVSSRFLNCGVSLGDALFETQSYREVDSDAAHCARPGCGSYLKAQHSVAEASILYSQALLELRHCRSWLDISMPGLPKQTPNCNVDHLSLLPCAQGSGSSHLAAEGPTRRQGY